MPRSFREKKKALVKLSLWTLSLIAIISGLNALFIINSIRHDLFSPQRSLASVPSMIAVEDFRAAAPVIEIDCRIRKKELSLITTAASTRVYFRNCKKIGRLINESNRNQGDVFPLEKTRWTSDFISLIPGENLIKAPVGEFVQVIKITREVAQKTGR